LLPDPPAPAVFQQLQSLSKQNPVCKFQFTGFQQTFLCLFDNRKNLYPARNSLDWLFIDTSWLELSNGCDIRRKAEMQKLLKFAIFGIYQ
jgi:hypothetical protein